MNRAERQARKESSELRKRWKANSRQKQQEVVQTTESTVTKAFAQKMTSTQRLIQEARTSELIFWKLFVRRPQDLKISDKIWDLLELLARTAPRLIVPKELQIFLNLEQYEWVRDPKDWEPEGKSRDTQTRSLLEHLLARYPTPKFLWTAFSSSSVSLGGFADFMAKGGSLYDKVKSKEFPVPFTRRMCHDFLKTTSEYDFIEGIRRVQIKAHGGSHQLMKIWIRHELGSCLRSHEEEVFWDTVLHFFSKNPMIDYAQVEPLIDYIQFCRRGDRGFSMKGRSVLALMRGMNEWHGELAKEKAIKGTVFTPSGYKAKEYQVSQKGEHTLWKVCEILASKELAEEGRAMHHCVYSYVWRIESKACSIWSVSNDTNGRVMTVQVDNRSNSIIQYRGRYNKPPDNDGFRILKRWADENFLKIVENQW